MARNITRIIAAAIIESMRNIQLPVVLLWALMMVCCPLATGNSHEAISLNNEGVKLLNEQKWQSAIDKLAAAFEVEPSYRLPVTNLAIAHNCYGLSLKDHPKEALVEFHRALLLDTDRLDLRENTRRTISKIGLNPDKFEDREQLAEAAVKANDYPSAVIEFAEALQLKDSLAVRKKLDDAYDHLDAVYRTTDKQRLCPRSNTESTTIYLIPRADRKPITSPDSEEYMRSVETCIKRCLHPPQSDKSQRVVMQFDILKSGEVRLLKLKKNSGSRAFDSAALDAVEDAGPFEPVPPWGGQKLSIEFTFDYNAISKFDIVRQTSRNGNGYPLFPPSLAR
jgi:TonB family protein